MSSHVWAQDIATSSTLLTPEDLTISHRVRHLSSIQVCNLSPFPARDTLAFALAQPSAQSQFTSHGKFLDDLDITIGRKRARGFSSSSTTTRSVRWEHDKVCPAESSSKTISSSPSLSLLTGDSPTSVRKRNLASGAPHAPTTRPSNRPRALSTASFASSLHDSISDVGLLSSNYARTLLRDTSQAGLEHVFQSRLIETYVTVSIPQYGGIPLPSISPADHGSSENHVLQDLSPSSTSRRKLPVTRRHAATKSLFSPPSAQSYDKAAVRHDGSRSLRNKSMSLSFPSQDRTVFPLPQSNGSSLSFHNSASTLLTSNSLNYRSTIHRPSTNPSFPLDFRNVFRHLDNADLGVHSLHIEIWGRFSPNRRDGADRERGHSVDTTSTSESTSKLKEKDTFGDDAGWRVLQQWDVDLRNLVQLPEESYLHLLPSNTLVLSLVPPGRRYYLPSTTFPLNDHPASNSRSASPSTGYNSDPESDSRRRREAEGASDYQQSLPQSFGDITERSEYDELDTTIDRAAIVAKVEGRRLSANWQDLLKLTTIQTVIIDTKKSLSEVLQAIDQVVVQHPTRVLTTICNQKLINSKNREVSERRAYVRELEAEKGAVLDECQNLRNQIDSKREALRMRRRVLEEAEQTVTEEQRHQLIHEKTLGAERDALLALRCRAPPLRSNALATLAFIYPIELVSPPDLLFSILGVSLPIPLGASDPAPPTSLPSYRGVNEDTVATALGYAAHVIHLLAAYMNKNLTYPITYIGSRSLIKDGISAMVGPRMFPLFSKGVDTYRFEYAVFLLNKDVEMLMLDRDLRALDIRHTLPNLKNLLLTLTDPDSIPNTRLRLDAPSGIRSPSTMSSMLSDGTDADAPAEDSTESRSLDRAAMSSTGSTTPTNAAQAASRKSRNFLDLAPFTEFLRSRYPSTGKSAANGEAARGDSSAASTAEAQESSPIPEAEPDDEDDRRTIRCAHNELDVAYDKREISVEQQEALTADIIATQVVGKDPLEKANSGTVTISRGQVSV